MRLMHIILFYIIQNRLLIHCTLNIELEATLDTVATPSWTLYPANNFTLLRRCHNMTFLLWERCKVTLQQRKFVDSQIGCYNVVKQRCCITKLQPTYNLKIKIALNFVNVRSFKYQLNFFTLDFLKVIHGPLIFIFQLSLYFATT